MFDILYASYARKREKPLDQGFKPENAIQSEQLLNPGSPSLAVIFPGWHTHKFPVNILAKRLVKKDWAVLFYDFHDQILVPDEAMVEQSFRYLRDHIALQIENLIRQHGYEKVQLIGISLGNVPLSLVADKYRKFSGATLVLAGDSLAIDMWYGIRTVDYRHAFEKLHIGVRRLSDDWQNVSPVNYAQAFKGKPVKVVMSLHDRFIFTKYQKRFAEKLIENGAIVKRKKYRTGHALSIVRFCLFGSPL